MWSICLNMQDLRIEQITSSFWIWFLTQSFRKLVILTDVIILVWYFYERFWVHLGAWRFFKKISYCALENTTTYEFGRWRWANNDRFIFFQTQNSIQSKSTEAEYFWGTRVMMKWYGREGMRERDRDRDVWLLVCWCKMTFQLEPSVIIRESNRRGHILSLELKHTHPTEKHTEKRGHTREHALLIQKQIWIKCLRLLLCEKRHKYLVK